ncbi:MAG: serine protease [Candidatus Aquilonibacter sp.]
MDGTHISEQIEHTTARIEAFTNTNVAESGTGFFYQIALEGESVLPLLVTNRHMLAGKARLEISLTHADGQGNPKYGDHERYSLTDLQAATIYHPDPQVDLAAIFVGGILNDMTAKGRPAYHKSLSNLFLPSEADIETFTSFEDVLMVGYPNGIWDSRNNLPIARRGQTATPYARDYEGRKEFVIDAACFPGSSGSPIYLYNQGSYATRSGSIRLGGRFKLLGILYAGPVRAQHGVLAIVPIPTAHRTVAVSQSPIHLGFCIKSSQILALEPIAKAVAGLRSSQPAPQSNQSA